MRLNRYIADSTGTSRRQADDLIASGKVLVNGVPAQLGRQLEESDTVTIDGKKLEPQAKKYILLNKPVGYICSRAQQDANPTIYELLPPELSQLKTAGRLDKDSSGLVLLTNDGDFAQMYTHPKFAKEKEYSVTLDHPLADVDLEKLATGVELTDGISKLTVNPSANLAQYTVLMKEGRNRQIRRTFGALGYTVTVLQRVRIGTISLENVAEGEFREFTPQ